MDVKIMMLKLFGYWKINQFTNNHPAIIALTITIRKRFYNDISYNDFVKIQSFQAYFIKINNHWKCQCSQSLI